MRKFRSSPKVYLNAGRIPERESGMIGMWFYRWQVMWGICFDVLAYDGKLFHRIIEYRISADKSTARILKPVDNIEISADKVKPLDKPPVYIYGEKVSPVSHPDVTGSIRDIIWHFKDNEYKYYIFVEGRKKSRRYRSVELFKCSV